MGRRFAHSTEHSPHHSPPTKEHEHAVCGRVLSCNWNACSVCVRPENCAYEHDGAPARKRLHDDDEAITSSNRARSDVARIHPKNVTQDAVSDLQDDPVDQTRPGVRARQEDC